jgi:hypothetical protein
VKRLLLFSFLIFLSGCALLPKKVEKLEWPADYTCLTGEGNLEAAWGKEHFSGAFVVRMAYPDLFILEVYGPFGQTLVYVKKEAGTFLLVAGEEKTADEGVFEKKYGFSVRQFMDDLRARGRKEETPGGWTISRHGYDVRYGQDGRGRRNISWEGEKGSICLTFDDISFSRQ